MKKLRHLLITLAATAALGGSLLAVTPGLASAAVEPQIKTSESWQKVFVIGLKTSPRYVDSRPYLDNCPLGSFCIYALYDQTSTTNYWKEFGIISYGQYGLSQFNYDTSGQWIVNNQTDNKGDVITMDHDQHDISCYPTPPWPRPLNRDYARDFKPANWWPVWFVFNNSPQYC
jgi:hypothetical protein